MPIASPCYWTNKQTNSRGSTSRGGAAPQAAHEFSKTPGILILLLLAFASGCVSDQQKETLNSSRKALETRQPDTAIAHADQFLRKTPRGLGAAEALYLRGRGYEERVAGNSLNAAANLQAARTSYIQALTQSPSPVLDAYIRCSLANVAYFQDDYTTAIEQWATAYPKLDRTELKGWALYRLGVSQQRLGRFFDADRTFQTVRDRFPDSMPAQRAAQHQGVHAFYVQFAAFDNASGARLAGNILRKLGISPTQSVNSAGRHILRRPIRILRPGPRHQSPRRNRFPRRLGPALTGKTSS